MNSADISTVHDVLVAEGLEKKFTRGMKVVLALNGVSLKIEPRSLSVLYGPNGAGKTTLLRCLVGSAAPNKGTIVTSAGDRAVGYVPEGGRGIHGELTPQQNMTWARLAQGVSNTSPPPAPPSFLQDIWSLNKPASHLSRGQRQLLSLAVALTACPPFLLLDEPFNGLDPPSHAAMLAVLKDQAAQGTGILISTHDLRLSRWADQLYFMKAGQIVQTLDRAENRQSLLCVIDLQPGRVDEFAEISPEFDVKQNGEAHLSGSAADICKALSRVNAALVADIRINEVGLEALYYG